MAKRSAHCGDRRSVKLTGEGGKAPQMGSWRHRAARWAAAVSCRRAAQSCEERAAAAGRSESRVAAEKTARRGEPA